MITEGRPARRDLQFSARHGEALLLYALGWLLAGLLVVAIAVLIVRDGEGDEISLPPVRETRLSDAARAAGCQLRQSFDPDALRPAVTGPQAPAARPDVYTRHLGARGSRERCDAGSSSSTTGRRLPVPGWTSSRGSSRRCPRARSSLRTQRCHTRSRRPPGLASLAAVDSRTPPSTPSACSADGSSDGARTPERAAPTTRLLRPAAEGSVVAGRGGAVPAVQDAQCLVGELRIHDELVAPGLHCGH